MNGFHSIKKVYYDGRIHYNLVIVLFLISGINLTNAQIVNGKNPVLVSCKWVEENSADPDLVILHISAIERNYLNGHIPGSRFLFPGWLTVSNEKESTVPADMRQIRKVLEGLGISNQSHMVLCGSDGNLVAVSRVFVTLSHLGLEGRVSILQGGFEEWINSGRKVSSELPEFRKGNLVLSKQERFVNSDWMVRNLAAKEYFIIDARAKASYDGTPGALRQGHIPGAVNFPATSLYDSKTWHFVSEEKIKELFNSQNIPQGSRPVFYCNTGNTACVNYVAAIIAGYDPLLYDGSMEEWSSRYDLPIER